MGMGGGRRKRRGDSLGSWRKRRVDDVPGDHLDAPPPKRSANNKVCALAPDSLHPHVRCQFPKAYVFATSLSRYIILGHSVGGHRKTVMTGSACISMGRFLRKIWCMHCCSARSAERPRRPRGGAGGPHCYAMPAAFGERRIPSCNHLLRMQCCPLSRQLSRHRTHPCSR